MGAWRIRATVGAALTVLAGAAFGGAMALATGAAPLGDTVDHACNAAALGALLLAIAWTLVRRG